MRIPVTEGQDLPVEHLAVTPEGGHRWRVAEFPRETLLVAIGDIVFADLRDDGDATFRGLQEPTNIAEASVLFTRESERPGLTAACSGAGASIKVNGPVTLIVMPDRSAVCRAGRLIRAAEDAGQIAVVSTEVCA